MFSFKVMGPLLRMRMLLVGLMWPHLCFVLLTEQHVIVSSQSSLARFDRWSGSFECWFPWKWRVYHIVELCYNVIMAVSFILVLECSLANTSSLNSLLLSFKWFMVVIVWCLRGKVVYIFKQSFPTSLVSHLLILSIILIFVMSLAAKPLSMHLWFHVCIHPCIPIMNKWCNFVIRI